ncbi:MAG: aminotransferase class I/II-fold pyridoxal phosphate-dependent enzyme [Chloroflexota bacterium]
MVESTKLNVREELEAKLSEYIGVKYVIGASLGRTALFVLLQAINLTKEDEVVMPAYICEVVPNAVLKSGGIPVFVDTNPDDYHISAKHLESLLSKKTRAVIVNHIFGCTEDITRIREAISSYNIYLIEDAAHALGARLGEKRVGSLGDAAFFSLTKNISNCGGGIITTNNPKIADPARKLVEKARIASLMTQLQIGLTSYMETRRVHSTLANSFFGWLDFAATKLRFLTGEYYRELKIPDGLALSPKEARLALSQLARLDEQNKKRTHHQHFLNTLLKDATAFTLPKTSGETSGSICSWYPLRLKDPDLITKAIKTLAQQHVFLYKFWDPIPLQQRKYNDRQSAADVPNAIRNAASTLVFKMDPNMSEKQLLRIGNALLSVS